MSPLKAQAILVPVEPQNALCRARARALSLNWIVRLLSGTR